MANQGGGLKSTSINGVKMYTVVGEQRSLATWLNPKKLRALRKNQEYMQRVEVLQDLKFETATTRIKPTPDGKYLVASGFAGRLQKVCISLCGSSVCLHDRQGSYYSLRIPRMGRGLDYDSWSCNLLCAAASSPDLYRINLLQGRFLSPLSTRSPALNTVSRSKLHGLVACGGDDGFVECFDLRAKSSVGRINAVLPAGSGDQEVTAIAFDEDSGCQMGVGSSEGKGEGMTSIEPTGGAINDICVP